MGNSRVQIPVIGRHFQHESLDSSLTHVKTMCSSCGCKSAEGVKKNCGCGQDPCKTYGADSESYNNLHGWATNMLRDVKELIEDLENGAVYDLDDCRERLEKIRDDTSHLDAETFSSEYKHCDACEEVRSIDEFSLSNDPEQTLTEGEVCDYCFGGFYDAETFGAFSIDKDDEGKIHIENKCDGCGKEFLFTQNSNIVGGNRAGAIVYENLEGATGHDYPEYSPYGDLLCKSCWKEEAESDWDNFSRMAETKKPLLTGSVISGLALGLIYLMRGK